MAKKVTVWTLVILILIAVIVGVYFYNKDNSGNKNKHQAIQPTTVTQDFSDSDTDDITDDTSHDFDSLDATEYTPSDENLSDNTDDVTTTVFSIEQVIDHTTGQLTQPRVVFGSGYVSSDNYISFDSNGNFEMYLSGYSNNTTVGTYTEHDDFIFVEFEDGTAVEYEIRHNDDGVITYIIVNYGDYDIYFS